MKPRTVFLAAVGLFLVLVVAGATYLAQHLNQNKALIEQSASEALGREVRIEKGISLHWSVTPTIVLNGLWIGNPEWAKGDYLLRADRALVRVDLAALMEFRLSLNRVLLKDADVAFETAKNGKHNWDFSESEATGASLQIDRLVIEQSRLRFRPAAGAEHELAVAKLELRGLGGAAPAMSGEFEFQQVSFSLATKIKMDGAFGPTAGGKRDRLITFKGLNATVGDYDFTGTIRIPLERSERIEAELEIETADLSTRFLPVRLLADRPTGVLRRELPPSLLPSRDFALRLEVAHLQVGEFHDDRLILDASITKKTVKLAIADQADNLDIQLELVPKGSAWVLSFHNNSKFDLGLLVDDEMNDDRRPHAKVAVDVALAGTGESLGSVIESARGHINLDVGPGHLSEEISRYIPLGSVLSTLLQTIDDEVKPEIRSQVECVALRFDVNEGTAISNSGLALRTKELNVLGTGRIRLIDGEMDLQFKTAQREGLGIDIAGLADGMIRLTGTPQEPEIELEVGELVVRGLAAWATSGISILAEAIFNRLTAATNPCEKVLGAAG